MKHYCIYACLLLVLFYATACLAAVSEPESVSLAGEAADLAEKKTEKRGIYGFGFGHGGYYGGGFGHYGGHGYGGHGGYGGYGGYGGFGYPYQSYGFSHTPYYGHYPYHGYHGFH